ncbi:carboxypeptidase-like regulatory domain-containing protein [Membranihabitans marinus]|uniref:carboxypeptidase-like regulatory domain-containing protein n=1 Tax=Membranihabitans marinus TaxID=1227546 RepID=UPI001F319A20|nr:carboxypeptidase-like regulatory domain-containing protein [Membranihabitans marinus]
MRIFIIILWLLLTSFQVEVKAQNSALEGRVIDALSQNPLYGAHIYFPDLKTGTSSNEEGHFQMYIPAGQHRMRISYIGYDDIDTTIIIDQTKSVTFMMRSRLLKEVKIVADKLIPFNRKDAQGGSVLSLERAQFLPSFTGYPDPVKASLYLPGVSSSRDGASRIVIRGTEYDHHILAVDGVALPEYSHLFGLMSVMNPDLVQDVRVFKGAKPMVYSNVLGGVIDVRVASGSGEKTSNFTLGLLNSGYQQSGQLGKGSYNVGARISYFDIINLYPLLKNIREKSNFEIRFADAIDVGFKTQQPFLSGQLSMTVLGAFSNLGSKGEDLENYGGGYDFENYHYIQNNWVGLASIKSLHEIHSHWTWSNHLYVNANRPRLLGEDEGRNNANDNQFDRYFDNSDQYQSHRNMGYRSEWIRRNSENQKLSLGAQIESGHLITYKEFSEGLITLQEKSSTSATFGPFENQQSWTSLYANYGGSQEKWNYEGGIKAMYYFNQGQTILLPKVSLSYLLSGHSNLYFNYEASSQNKHIPYGDHLLLEYPQ